MNRRIWTGVVAGVLAAGLLLTVGFGAFRAGQDDEVATRVVQTSEGEVVRVVGDGHHWGPGPGFFFIPLLIILLVVLFARGRHHHGGGWHGGPGWHRGPGPYGPGPGGPGACGPYGAGPSSRAAGSGCPPGTTTRRAPPAPPAPPSRPIRPTR